MGGLITVKAKNLKHRTNGWYAELYVPPPLRPVVGRKVYRKNLHTHDVGTALALRDGAMAELRAKLATATESARGRVTEDKADWLVAQIEGQRARLTDLEREAARSQDAIRWALGQIKVMDPEHPAAVVGRAEAPTFREAADAHIAMRSAKWRKDEWTPGFVRHVYPHIGSLPVNLIDTETLLQFLAPLATTAPTRADRMRARIEDTLDYAKTRGWRTGDNPARWNGHMEHTLPGKQPHIHHAAMAWQDLPGFMSALAERAGMPALALRFTILTAARTAEVLRAVWPEVDIEARTWTVPANRMKTKREHRVPLSEPAMAILSHLQAQRLPRHGDVVFPGRLKVLALSVMWDLIRDMGHDMTAHGFRSTFRQWCQETGKPDDVAEMALAHVKGDATVRAYARSDVFDRRKLLMEEWAAFCMSNT